MADNTPGGGADNGDAMRIDTALVRELAELLTANELTEIEVEDGDRKIKVCRDPAPVIAAAPAPAATAAPAAAPPAAAASSAAAEEEVTGNTLKSPMVGTVFLSPDPGSPPFVAVGDTVKVGDTLMIVEAMKVMNPITATHGGVLKKVLVADAQPVEFDQPLAIIG